MNILRGGIFDLAESLYDRYLDRQECQPEASDLTDPQMMMARPNIFRRDSCTDAFGSGWSANTCTPGNTLCCVKENESLPTCTQDLGIGWCCTADGGCYADLSSSCGQPGAISCTELAAGVDEACCPQHTTCANEYNATESFVRCNIKSAALESIAATTATLSGASTRASASEASTTSSVGSSTSTASIDSMSTSTSISLPSSSPSSIVTPSVNALDTLPTTSSSALLSSSTSTPQPQPTGISLTTGEITGIVVASASGALLLVAVWWLLRRRNRSRKKKFAMPMTPSMSSSFGDLKRTMPVMLEPQHGVSEMPAHADPVELPNSRWSRKQTGFDKHVSVAGTYELGS